MTTTLKILQAAKKLIQKKENWITGPTAKSKSGRTVPCLSKAAVKFCALGAVYNAAQKLKLDGFGPVADDILDKAAMSMGYPSSVGLNESTKASHPLVMKMYNKAIALAKEEKDAA